MKVTKKLLSIPPYLSTGWENVGAIRVDGEVPLLVVQLIDGTNIQIPNLDRPTIQKIFLAHEQYLEGAQDHTAHPEPFMGDQVLGLPLRFGIGGFEGIGGPGGMMQHDPTQAGAPDLPSELLQKVAGIAGVLGVSDTTTLPEAEADCNCFHCQIVRALRHQFKEEGSSGEEEVSDDDLVFRTWDVSDRGDKLYIVTNPLDSNEQYSVFLGDPIGCTCGQKSCEHIQAVLRT
ncbi:MAG: hypothetical protein AB7F31_06860 [Parachlamydiales bacterium]